MAGSALRSWRGSNCFIAGTLVLTAAGLKKIEEIQVGDMVLAYDEETGEQAYKPVKQLFRNTTKEWYHVRVHGEEIVCTGGHPFYVVGEGFVCAKNLKVSDRLLLSDGTCAIIEAIQIKKLEKSETTYNFEVADFHTYYVSESNILVHNLCTTELKQGTKEWNKAVKDIKNSTNKKGKLNYIVKDQQTAVKLMEEAGLPFKGKGFIHDDILNYTLGVEQHAVDNAVGLQHFKFWSGRTNGHVYWLNG